MNQPHPVGVHRVSPPIEGTAPAFRPEFLLRAREKTIEVLGEIRSQIQEGQTEDDARKMALAIFADHGVKKHWHKPYIRFGSGTALTFFDPLQPDYRLREGDPYYLDLGPVWSDVDQGLEYEGDYGDTFVLGKNPEAEKCAQAARDLFAEAKNLWKKDRASGQDILRYLDRRAKEHGYELLEKVSGHRLGDFPHQKYSKERFFAVNFTPAESLWILEVFLKDPANRFGAFFEDLL